MENSPLAKLPRELRASIYNYVLSQPNRINISVKIGKPTLHRISNAATRINLTLLQTCRQIQHEATPIFYQTNTFTFITQIFPLVSNLPPNISSSIPGPVSVAAPKGPETIHREIRRRFDAVHDWLDRSVGSERIERLKPVRVDLGRCNLALAGRRIGEFEGVLREEETRLRGRFRAGGVFVRWEPF